MNILDLLNQQCPKLFSYFISFCRLFKLKSLLNYGGFESAFGMSDHSACNISGGCSCQLAYNYVEVDSQQHMGQCMCNLQ